MGYRNILDFDRRPAPSLCLCYVRSPILYFDIPTVEQFMSVESQGILAFYNDKINNFPNDNEEEKKLKT